MSELELIQLEARVDELEEKVDAVLNVLNDLIELIYEPSYVKKLDKLADYGNGKGKESDTVHKGGKGE